VLSPTSGRVERILKVREYAVVPSTRRYVILESTSIGLTVLERSSSEDARRTTILTSDETLLMPEIGIEIPVSALYEDITFPEEA
jgi:hypothetical protein